MSQLGQPGSPPAEAGPYGPDRHPEGLGDLLVAQLLPGEEQQDLPFGLGQRPDGIHHPRPQSARVSHRHRPLRRVVVQQPGSRDPESRCPGQGPEPAGLTPVVLGHQVGGDAVQPGPGRVPVPLERRPPLEGDTEHLAQQVLGLGRVDPAGQESQQRRPVPVEDDTKRPRRPERLGDHGPV